MTHYIQNFNNILQSFKINANCVNHQIIDNYFFYDVKLNPSSKIKDLQKYGDEISLALKTTGRPNIKILRDQGLVRFEFAAPRTNRLNLFEYFSMHDIPNGELNCLLGQAVDGSKVWFDLAQAPHLIVGGATNSGKSVLINNIIGNLLTFNKSKLLLLDPKRIEFSAYDKFNIPNVKVGYTYEDAMSTLNTLLSTMESRYDYIRRGYKTSNLPYIVLIIDEFADLILQDKENEFYIKLCKLAQKCRAAKINIILSTQRPSVNIINGTIKANFPARISCRVASSIDSRIILDISGAENLQGKGDALIKDNFRNLERFQVAYTSAEEVCQNFA